MVILLSQATLAALFHLLINNGQDQFPIKRSSRSSYADKKTVRSEWPIVVDASRIYSVFGTLLDARPQ